jgi:hypothetical protein
VRTLHQPIALHECYGKARLWRSGRRLRVAKDEGA